MAKGVRFLEGGRDLRVMQSRRIGTLCSRCMPPNECRDAAAASKDVLILDRDKFSLFLFSIFLSLSSSPSVYLFTPPTESILEPSPRAQRGRRTFLMQRRFFYFFLIYIYIFFKYDEPTTSSSLGFFFFVYRAN